MKLRFVVTPQTLASELAAHAAALKQAGLTGRTGSGESRSWTSAIAAADTPELRAAVSELADSCAGWPATAFRVQCELDVAAASDVASAPPHIAPAPGATFHDLDGARVHEVLPRLLAHVSAASGVAPLPSSGAGGRPTAVAPRLAARFVDLDAARGAQITVVERLRALACAGATPVAVDAQMQVPAALSLDGVRRLNALLRALVDAAQRLDVTLTGAPLVPSTGLEPVLNVAAAGALADDQTLTPPVVQEAGQQLVLLGEAPHELGGSAFAATVHGANIGPAPELDLSSEKRLNKVLLALIRGGVVVAARHVAAGGLLVTASAMLFATARTFGAKLDMTPLGGARADALLFGESQGRVLVAVAAERVGTVLSEAQIRGVPAALIGEVTDASVLSLKTRSLATEWDVGELRTAAGR